MISRRAEGPASGLAMAVIGRTAKSPRDQGSISTVLEFEGARQHEHYLHLHRTTTSSEILLRPLYIASSHWALGRMALDYNNDTYKKLSGIYTWDRGHLLICSLQL